MPYCIKPISVTVLVGHDTRCHIVNRDHIVHFFSQTCESDDTLDHTVLVLSTGERLLLENDADELLEYLGGCWTITDGEKLAASTSEIDTTSEDSDSCSNPTPTNGHESKAKNSNPPTSDAP